MAQSLLTSLSLPSDKEVLQSGACREIASELLGSSKVDLASFSFDGENAGKIVMNSKYDDYNFQVKYSLDGGNTWETTLDHQISLGGNVQAIGTKTDGSRWKVGVQSPDDTESMIGAYEAADEAVITSGAYERYFEKDGKTYHHIIDTATGKPSEKDLKSVTIISKNGTLSDTLSTTLFVMGKDKAISYWKEHSKEFNMILVDENNKVYISQGIKDHFSSDSDFTVIKK